MDLFSCNQCKRCPRRTSSSGDEENDIEHRRHSTNFRSGRLSDDCCAAAAMYFYAVRRRSTPGREQHKPEVEMAPLDGLELAVSTGSRGGGCARASILKKSADACLMSAPSSVGARRSPSVGVTDKRASFNEAVDVIVADDAGHPVVADSIRLKRSPELCSDLAARATTDRDVAARQRRPKQAFAKMVFPPASRCQHAFQLASTDVERRADGSRYLRAVIRPAADDAGGGSGARRQTPPRDERVVVRAAGKGSRLVVGAYRPEPLGDGTNYLRQYVDRFPLPHAIEMTSIQANRAPTGDLVVTAAINDSSEDSYTDYD